MPLHTDKLGAPLDAHTDVVDGDRARAYAAATNDDNPAYASGAFAPPVFGVVPAWVALFQAVGDIVPAEALPMIVHGSQDMRFHRPLVPGVRLVTRATPESLRVGGTGTRLVVRVDSTDEGSGEPVLTQYATIFVRGLSEGESAGPDAPEHRLPAEARQRPIGALTVHVDDDQTFRYRKASGDTNPIHVDEGFAKAVGLPGIIVHGLCTMAMCSQAVVKLAADGDPGRLRRLAVRFSKPVFPGRDLVVSLYEGGASGTNGRRVVHFEAASDGDRVVKDGLAEVAG